MNTVQKAIPTLYRGTSFKSRSEARYAVFLDSLNLHFEYEPLIAHIRSENPLYSGLLFKPDFYIAPWMRWIELKGRPPEDIDLLKCRLLARTRKEEVVLSWGDIDQRSHESLQEDGAYLFLPNGEMLDHLWLTQCPTCCGINYSRYGLPNGLPCKSSGCPLELVNERPRSMAIAAARLKAIQYKFAEVSAVVVR